MRKMTCSTSAMLPVRLFAGMASALSRCDGSAAAMAGAPMVAGPDGIRGAVLRWEGRAGPAIGCVRRWSYGDREAERAVTEGSAMHGSPLEVRTGDDGSVIVRPCGPIGLDDAVELRQTLVHAVRKVRPARLFIDLAEVTELDPINLGTLAAVCGLGDDHQVAVFLDNPSAAIAAELTAAGVPRQRLRTRADEPPPGAL